MLHSSAADPPAPPASQQGSHSHSVPHPAAPTQSFPLPRLLAWSHLQTLAPAVPVPGTLPQMSPELPHLPRATLWDLLSTPCGSLRPPLWSQSSTYSSFLAPLTPAFLTASLPRLSIRGAQCHYEWVPGPLGCDLLGGVGSTVPRRDPPFSTCHLPCRGQRTPCWSLPLHTCSGELGALCGPGERVPAQRAPVPGRLALS